MYNIFNFHNISHKYIECHCSYAYGWWVVWLWQFRSLLLPWRQSHFGM